MANRKQRRMMDKAVKSRLTPEQFKELKDEAFEMRVKEEVDRFIGNFVSVYKPAMKDNRISDERAERIIEDVFNRATERFVKGEKGESRPQEAYLDKDGFVQVAEKVLKSHSINKASIIAEEMYKKIMEAAGGGSDERLS